MEDKKWHRWTLKSSAGKATCPQCGHKNRLSPYWDNVHELKMDVEVYGLCDRIGSCGFHYAPWMDQKQGIPYFYKKGPIKERKVVHLDESAYMRDTDAICGTNSHLAATISGEYVFRKYRCRTEVNNDSLVYYPYINKDGYYRAVAGHRYRSGELGAYRKDAWYHSRHVVPKGYNTQDRKVDCFFGEHLLAANPDFRIGIVEGPKTAILCDRYLGDGATNWIATFNQQSIYRDMKIFERLGKVDVYVIPDKDSADYWSALVKDADALYINMSIKCVDISWRLKDGESDIGDYLFRTKKRFDWISNDYEDK